MKISIIHPSRQRPELALMTAKNWLEKLSNEGKRMLNWEYILSIDESDPDKEKYRLINCFGLEPQFKVVVNDNNTAIEAINNAAKVTTGDLLIVVSDDFDCPQNWDTDLLNYLKGKSDFVVKTWDGLQPWIMTLPIMDRVYYERFGYIYNPGYKHMFCDTEMSHVADLLDKAIIVPMTFQHNHYSQPGGLKRDAITTKNDRTWAQGEKLYLERLYRNFDIPDSEIKGVLRCNKEHLSWLKSKGVNFEIV